MLAGTVGKSSPSRRKALVLEKLQIEKMTNWEAMRRSVLGLHDTDEYGNK
jgi:hypothetical protein